MARGASPDMAPQDLSGGVFDERLISEAVVATASLMSQGDLELDRLEDIGPWRARRLAHQVAREIGTREGMDLYQRLRFMGGVRRAVSNVRLLDRVRHESQEED